MLESRETMFEFMSTNAVCAEIRVFQGDFSRLILDTTRPRKLHLFDIAPEATDIARRRFAKEVG